MMTPRLLEVIDYGILGGGTVLIISALARLGTREIRQAGLILPPPPTNRLEPVDVLFALFCVFFLPPMAGQIFGFAGIDVSAGLGKYIAPGIGVSLAIAALLVVGASRFDGGLRGWGLSVGRPGWLAGRAIAGYLVAAPICMLGLKASAFSLNRLGYPSPQHDTIKLLMDPATPRMVQVLAIFHAVILAAVAEELLFRGILQPALAKWSGSAWKGILVSGALFGLIHHPYDETVLPLAAFGVILGYLYARTGSLSLAIATHALFNAKTILWIFLGASPD